MTSIVMVSVALRKEHSSKSIKTKPTMS